MATEILFLDEIELTVRAREHLEGVGTIAVAAGPTQDELPALVSDTVALVFQQSPLHVTGEVLDAAPKLKVIGRIGIGMDQVDVAAASSRNITVVNAAGAQAAAVADHAFGLLLCLARNIVQGDSAVRAGEWAPPQSFMGHELTQKTLGVVGFGAIGRQLAGRAISFGMNVLAFDPYVPPAQIAEANVTPLDLPALLTRSDYISVHVPLTPETRHLIAAEDLRLMSSGAYLINTSRGAVVDEAALIDALKHDRIAGAGLDVFEREPLAADSPFVRMRNVVLTPHIGGWTIEGQARTQEAVAEDVARVIEGLEPFNPVTA